MLSTSPACSQASGRCVAKLPLLRRLVGRILVAGWRVGWRLAWLRGELRARIIRAILPRLRRISRLAVSRLRWIAWLWWIARLPIARLWWIAIHPHLLRLKPRRLVAADSAHARDAPEDACGADEQQHHAIEAIVTTARNHAINKRDEASDNKDDAQNQVERVSNRVQSH